MIPPKKYKDEVERIKSLELHSILDTLPEMDFDNLTMLAAEICDTPISLVTFIDKERQWFKSCFGLDVFETPRVYSFCAHAINNPNDIFIVPDSRKDERFFDNPIVAGDPNVIFYAGVPLIDKNGLPLGTLCVIDRIPRELTPNQIRALKALSDQIMRLLELKLNKIELEKSVKKLKDRNIELEKFAYKAAHDLKSPLSNILGLTNMFIENYGNSIDAEGYSVLNLIKNASDRLKKMIQSLLEYSKSDQNLKEIITEVNLQNLKEEISSLLVFNDNCQIRLKSNLSVIKVDKMAINQIMINLVSNAIKYNDKEITEIDIEVTDEEDFYRISVSDNGLGISKEYHEKIFNLFEVFAAKDRFGETGNGIGLATVKKIVESFNGTIYVESELGKGAKFIFTISKL